MPTLTAIDPETLAAVQTFAERIRRDFQVERILLYGSRARGDHKPDSDVDIAILLPKAGRRKMDVALEMGHLADDILIDAGLFFQPIPVWPEEWADPSLANNPWLVRNIKAEGIDL